uniref:Uncharacterized protein n=1 Tax=Anguilla anguilla TaxID=7936 RepID=A0A0E9PIC2_ANGAN
MPQKGGNFLRTSLKESKGGK